MLGTEGTIDAFVEAVVSVPFCHTFRTFACRSAVYPSTSDVTMLFELSKLTAAKRSTYLMDCNYQCIGC